jgi:hypothetical protein
MLADCPFLASSNFKPATCKCSMKFPKNEFTVVAHRVSHSCWTLLKM